MASVKKGTAIAGIPGTDIEILKGEYFAIEITIGPADDLADLSKYVFAGQVRYSSADTQDTTTGAYTFAAPTDPSSPTGIDDQASGGNIYAVGAPFKFSLSDPADPTKVRCYLTDQITARMQASDVPAKYDIKYAVTAAQAAAGEVYYFTQGNFTVHEQVTNQQPAALT